MQVVFFAYVDFVFTLFMQYANFYPYFYYFNKAFVMKKEEKTEVLSSRYLFNDPWLTVREEKIKLPNGKIVPHYFVLEYPDWVNTIARTKDGKFVMIRQYRHAIGKANYELCGGCVENGEEPVLAAQRELLEETGFGGGKWRQNLRLSSNPSTNHNWVYNFIAEDVEPVGEPALDEGEDLSCHLLSLEEVKNLLKNNEIIQSVHACALWKYLSENRLL